MSDSFTVSDLTRLMREVAGEDENVDLDGDILDLDFADLGYDSLAILETSGRIARDYGIVLEDDALNDAHTPRALVGLVNEQFHAVGGAGVDRAS
ncbi:acyl carrier protein [Frankia sp. QA3]|uniref:acyl carrier protein n=1 Tax=Frankia sp. QA3 TaxID=710111 RepID=UPI000269CEDE|nr:acyl carrier protein [Frankia sp. QA3]EIV96255.1 phosphopantetheine-containing protein [Frankia sp. QA3]